MPITAGQQRELWRKLREYSEGAARLAVATVQKDPSRELEKKRFYKARSELASFIQSITEKVSGG